VSAVPAVAGNGAVAPGATVGAPAALVFEHVSHWYGQVVAVNDISCSVGAGITGLLGPNGAGKSTLLALAAGLAPPSSGSVRVFGEPPSRGPSVYRGIALVPERESLPPTLSARAFVETRATLLGIRDARGAAQRALEIVEMDTVASRQIGGFSKGMKQRTKLAAALVHEPQLVLLDEPFNGLDPRQRLHMMRLLESRAANGTTVLLSSHILEEIQGVASRILVMLAGRLAASGDYRTLRRLMTDRPHTVRVRTSNDRLLASALLPVESVVGVELTPGGLMVRTTDYTAFARAVAPAAQRQQVTVYEVQPADESLEHVFAYLVGR
jgi:ABC-2 type transport system ATP-binding protein